MFNIEELKRYDNNILYELKKVLKRDIKRYEKEDNRTLYQFTRQSINDINHILELRGEKWKKNTWKW